MPRRRCWPRPRSRRCSNCATISARSPNAPRIAVISNRHCLPSTPRPGREPVRDGFLPSFNPAFQPQELSHEDKEHPPLAACPVTGQCAENRPHERHHGTRRQHRGQGPVAEPAGAARRQRHIRSRRRRQTPRRAQTAGEEEGLAKDAPVACNVLAKDEDAAEISLAENEMRQAMHPADQFEAFKALVDSGHGIEDIAARFGVTPTVVRQRLKLAAVSPKLMALYRKAAMSLDQLMAFTVSDDHAAQEAAWFDAPEWQRSAPAIRQTAHGGACAGGRPARALRHRRGLCGGWWQRRHRPLPCRQRQLPHRSRVARPTGDGKAGTRSGSRAA